MEQHQLFGPESVRKPKLEDDEWSLQVSIMPLQGLLKSLQGKVQLIPIGHDTAVILTSMLICDSLHATVDLQSSAGGYSKLVLDSRLYTWALGRELGY